MTQLQNQENVGLVGHLEGGRYTILYLVWYL